MVMYINPKIFSNEEWTKYWTKKPICQSNDVMEQRSPVLNPISLSCEDSSNFSFFYSQKKLQLNEDTKEIALHNKTKCIFDGEIYVRGGRIRPDGTCYECYCDEHLKIHEIDVTLSQCQRKQCGIGINGEEHDYLNRGCVPVYDKTATTCCPIDWRCREY